jgi:signal peptidase I
MRSENLTHLHKLINNWAVPIGCGLVFLFLLKFVFFFGYVPTASMEPVIPAGSFIFGLRITGEPQRGDVIVFRHDGKTLVKRVAAIPGDAIVIAGAPISVPKENYFVLGDNAAESIDSRFWTAPFVAKDSIIARVLGV